jgi:hypothetical protein
MPSGGAYAPADVAPLRHRNDLQGLRAIAVLVVALAHAGVPFLTGGFIGVDIFFVLSGFLITSLLLNFAEKHGSISLREFYSRRARGLGLLTVRSLRGRRSGQRRQIAATPAAFECLVLDLFSAIRTLLHDANGGGRDRVWVDGSGVALLELRR